MGDGTVSGIAGPEVTRYLLGLELGLTAPIAFELIAGGHSNLTYRCTDAGGRELVLRRPPLGHVLQSAHDMAREHRVISALADSGVPVPETLALCEDTAVNGAPFYVMAYVAGDVLHDRDAVGGTPMAERAALLEHTASVLAALHAVDPEAVGLGDLGRREGYIERQLKRWSRQWEATRTHPIPAMEDVHDRLAAQIPEQQGSTIVHGDYRLGNFIVGGGCIRAVLDWELCTLGDPLADVAYLANTWVSTDDYIEGADEHMPTLEDGFGRRDALLAAYAEHSGRDLSNIGYYRAFSYWRIAAIRQGVYKRYAEGVMGATTEEELARFRGSVARCAEAAQALLDAG